MNGEPIEGDDESVEAGVPIEAIAAGAGAFDVAVFAYVGYVLFEEPVFGGLVGALIGLGAYLMLPYLAGTDGPSGADTAPAAGRQTRGFHRGAAGFALSTAGIALLAWRFVSEAVLPGVGGAVAVCLLEYAVLARALPRD